MENTQTLCHLAVTAAGTVISQTAVVMELCASSQYPVAECLVVQKASLVAFP